MVGCIDIILLHVAAYVIICVHDRNRRQEKTKFSSRCQSTGRSTAYKNSESDFFFYARLIFFLLNYLS